VKHWLKHLKYGESILPYLSLLEKFTFQKLGCSGPVEMRRAELKHLMLTFSDPSIFQDSTIGNQIFI